MGAMPYLVAEQHLIDAGFTGWRVINFAAIGMAESRLDPWAIHLNTHDPSSRAFLSLDAGWLQINDFYQTVFLEVLGVIDPRKPFVMQMCDPAICAKAAFAIFGDNAENYNLWSTFKNGLHKPFLAEARKFAKQLGVAGA